MKFCVIGIGRFGYHVATTLAENGMEVIAVDSNESIVASIRDNVTQAVCMHVTSEDDLRSIGVDQIDTAVVAMGENFAESILITALLKQKLKTPTVITRSVSETHRDILALIGADKVILPEMEVGIMLAESLSLPFQSLVSLSPEFSISQLKAPEEFLGRSIGDLEAELESAYDIKCIAHRKDKEVIPPAQDYIIQEGDVLIFSGENRNLAKINKL